MFIFDQGREDSELAIELVIGYLESPAVSAANSFRLWCGFF